MDSLTRKIKTIAYPVLATEGIYSQKMIEYMSKECMRLHLQLVIMDGVSFNASDEIADLYREMAEIISNGHFDAMLFSPGYLSSLMTERELDNFILRWRNMPIISLGKKLDYCPSILIDNASGIIEAVEHLVKVHQKKEIAFIAGPMSNHEAVERLDAYKKGLQKTGLTYNPELVYPGDFFVGTGTTVARRLLDNGGKLPEAFITCNDVLAMDFITELTRCGIKVPGDVAVIGFDDIEKSANFEIPLTTVKQPFEEILHQALLSIVDVLNGKKTGDHILPSNLNVRNSCGCIQESVRIVQDKTNLFHITEKPGDIFTEIEGELSVTSESYLWLIELIRRLNTTDFSSTEEHKLLEFFHDNVTTEKIRPLRGEIWQKALSIIRRQVLPTMTETSRKDSFLNLMDQFRLLLAHQTETDHLSGILNSSTNYTISRRSLNVITTSQTEKEFHEYLTSFFETFQIKTCEIFLYDEPFEISPDKSFLYPKTLKQIYSLRNGAVEQLNKDNSALPISDFLDVFPEEFRTNHSIYLKLLEFHNHHYGFMLFEWDFEKYIHLENIKQTVSITHYSICSIKAMEAVEEELRQANLKLQELDRAKTNFFSNISHELRTPLTLISGPVESILAGDYGQMLPHNLPVFESIFRNSQRLLKLINSLLDFSKMDAGKLVLKPKKTNLSAVLRFYQETVMSGAASRSISLDFTDHTDGLIAFIDRDLFEKAFFNLISNALKFTAAGGSINISLTKTSDKEFTVSVADSGIGIPEDKLSKIFDRFVQVDSSSSRKYEGTGIGLAFVKEIAALMGGDISVKSKIGSGSCFTLRLPIGNPTGEAESDDIEAIEDVDTYLITEIGSGKTASGSQTERPAAIADTSDCILVVDDNSDLREFIKSVLAKDYKVITAVNGQDGFHKALEQKPDLILSDVMMPVMDGYQFARAVKKESSLAGIPFVLLTAKADVSMKIEGLEMGADDYLSKPFNSRELLARIRVLLEMKRQRDLLTQKKSLLETLVKEQTKTIEEEKDNALGLKIKAEKQLEDFLLVLASAIETKDSYTGGHVERVAGYARELAREYGLSEPEVISIYLGAIVHDVGKIGIRDAILNKPGKLEPDEYKHIQSHTEIGMRLLSKIKDIDTPVIIAWCHQERWDGKGYPRGLKGGEIPLAARIVTIADYWDSIITDRPYRSAMPLTKALELMHEERGKAFDPDLFDLFMNEQKKIYLMYHTPKGS